MAVPQRLEKVYLRDCAGGKWPQLAAELHAAAVPTPPPVSLARAAAAPRGKAKSYVVRKGDTLATIARKSGCRDPRDVAKANGLRGPQYAIKPGQTLKLPDCS